MAAPARQSGPRIGPPSSPTARVRRPRLANLLDRTFDRKLTVIAAGPGFGKTSTVSGWVERRRAGHRFAWLTLDRVDDSPHAFWTGVLAAVRASGAVPDGSALAEIQPATVFGPRQVEGVLTALADLPDRLVLVLDDFHLITDQEVLESVGMLLAHLPPPLRLVMTTRADPVLPLHRIRVAGQLTEIRSRDLAFTVDEAADLFRLEGIDLSPEQVEQLHRRTEGWPAGLRLAAMSMDRADPATSIDRVTGNDRAIAEYLVGEVLQRATPADREFLLRTSVVERLCADLADRLTDRTDGAQVLTRLLAANAFVTALDDTWVTYHPLLRELLRHRLSIDDADLVPDLYRRVAAWLAENGEPVDAVRYSIKALDWDGAGRTLMTCVTLIVSVRAPALAAAVEPLARRALTEPGVFELIAASAFHMDGRDYAAMRRDTIEGRQYLDSAPVHLRATAAVVLELFDTAYHRSTGDADSLLAQARSVLRTLETATRREVPLARHFRAIAATNLGVALLWTGDLDAADQAFTDSERQLGEVGLEISLLNTVAQQSVLDAMVGRCRRVEQRAGQALRLVERRGWGSEPQGLGIYLATGLLHITRDEPEAAGPVLRYGLATSGPRSDRMVRLGLAIGAVELAVLQSDGAGALEADARLQDGLSRTPVAPEHIRCWAAVAGANALIVAGRPAEAVDRLGDPPGGRSFCSGWHRVALARAHLELGATARVESLLLPLVQPGWPCREPVVAARLLLAVVADRLHRDGIALEHVTAAIALAQAEGIRRPFRQLSDRLAPILHRYRVLGGKHAGFVAGLLDDPIAGPVAAAGVAIVEPLTERELTIVKYLPTMLKAAEIGADLFVSVNTVKAHLRSIYRKLDVRNRRDAVERARSLGLL